MTVLALLSCPRVLQHRPGDALRVYILVVGALTVAGSLSLAWTYVMAARTVLPPEWRDFPQRMLIRLGDSGYTGAAMAWAATRLGAPFLWYGYAVAASETVLFVGVLTTMVRDRRIFLASR